EGARMKEIIGPNGEVHSGYLSNGVSETFGPEFEICYPHAVMMRSLPSYWRWPGNSFVYSGPVEDYQGLPGMRMTVQAIDVTLWFSPEHDLFPIRSLQCSTTPDKWVYRSIHTVQEFGTAEYKDLSVYYPKNYTYETLARGSNTFCRKYVMDIRSIQFHEFDPQLHPAVTFPRGMQVFDYRNQDAHVEYRTLFRETHPGGYWNSYTIANAIVYGIMIAILPGIWLIVRLHKKFRAERRNL
ncbi:MAG TPA: hypothetical protein PLZ55_04650, partial [bacterium]|nr:hypothetical protein [bacterium]